MKTEGLAGGGNTPGIFRSVMAMSWKAGRARLRVGMSLAAAVLVGATMYWYSRPASPDALEVSSSGSTSQPALAEVPRAQPETALTHTAHTSMPAPTRTQAATTDPEDSTIADYTSQKYQFLLDDLRYLKAAQVEQLQRALLARERLAGQANDPDAMARVEGEIRGLLRPDDYATYETLKDSDLELFKLNEYAAGIDNVAPLSTADRESILRTKLAYKERFRQLMLDSGLQRSDLSPAEREYAYSVTSHALEGYRQSYLQEVRQYLTNEEQFALLNNYETTEFKAELARLQSMVGVPVQGGS
jgi:hypothetical protein